MSENRRGPAGPPGATGPAGPKGDPGADGDNIWGGKYHPDRAPSDTTAALTDEFDGASAATWLWGNQDAAADTIEMGTAYLNSVDAEATTVDGPNCRLLADPSTLFQSDFMLASKVTVRALGTLNGGGLTVVVGGSGNPVVSPTTLYGLYKFNNSNDPAISFFKKTDYTGSITDAGSEAAAKFYEGIKWDSTPIYLALVYAAATKALNGYYAIDGMTWMNHGGTAATLAAHPSYIGRSVDAQNMSVPAQARFHWFRFFPAAAAARWANLDRIQVGAAAA